MKPYHAITLLCFTLSIGCASTIIDSTSLNGSFESGSITPWGGGTVVQDPGNAPDGVWYAQTAATVNRASLYMFFTAVDPSNKDFELKFFARAVGGEFQNLSPYIFGRTVSNGFLYASVVTSSGATLSDGWNFYSYTFSFSEDWDVTKSMSVGFDFTAGNVGSTGLIDQVSLAQIPEPSSIALYLSGVVLIGALIKRKLRRTRRYSE